MALGRVYGKGEREKVTCGEEIIFKKTRTQNLASKNRPKVAMLLGI